MKGKVLLSAALCFAAASGTASAQSALPDPARTPGAVNPAVTQANINDTICVPGWTATVRPPESYTERLKRRQIAEYGYADRRLGVSIGTQTGPRIGIQTGPLCDAGGGLSR